MASNSGYVDLSNPNSFGYPYDQSAHNARSSQTVNAGRPYQSDWNQDSTSGHGSEISTFSSSTAQQDRTDSFPWYRTSTPGVSTYQQGMVAFNDQSSEALDINRDGRLGGIGVDGTAGTTAARRTAGQQYGSSTNQASNAKIGTELESFRRAASAPKQHAAADYTTLVGDHQFVDFRNPAFRNRYSDQTRDASNTFQMPQHSPQYPEHQPPRASSRRSVGNDAVSLDAQAPLSNVHLYGSNTASRSPSSRRYDSHSAGKTPILPVPVSQPTQSPSPHPAYQSSGSGFQQASHPLMRPLQDQTRPRSPRNQPHNVQSRNKKQHGRASSGLSPSLQSINHTSHMTYQPSNVTAANNEGAQKPQHFASSSSLISSSQPQDSYEQATEMSSRDRLTATPAVEEGHRRASGIAPQAPISISKKSPVQRRSVPQSGVPAPSKRRRISGIDDAGKTRATAIDALAYTTSSNGTTKTRTPDPPVASHSTHAPLAVNDERSSLAGGSACHPPSTMIPTIPSPGADKGEMESHLRAMLDSVRQIQAHNPSMFSQVWEQVKKGPKADNASPLTVNDRRPVAEGIGQPPPIASTRSTHDAEDNGRFESLGVRMSDINPQDPSFGVAPADTLLTVSSPAPRVSVESSPSMATVQPPNASAHQTVQVSTDPQVINALLTKPSSSGSPAPMGQTIWPELSKPFLATAAVEQLKEDPENADLSITTQHVKAILDRNLSYVHLCLILEQQGFKFDRKIFANALLGAASGPHMARNTPAIGGQQEHLTTQDQAQRPMTSTNRPQISKLPSSESPAVPDLSNGQSHALAREASGTTTSRRPTDSADVKIATTVAGDSGVASRQSPTATGQAAPQTHFPVQPTSKAQAAHKRTFAEIVDLTEEVSDFAEPAKVTQKNDDGTKGVMTSLAGRSGLNTAYPTLEPSGVPSHKSSTSTNGVHPPSYDAARSKTAQLRQMDIIKSLPSKSAKKRPTKVLRTVAEDVLIASGRHPQKRGLNDHLQPLKKFIAVSNSSDLGSFRWASVDPNAKPARTRRQSATAPTKPDCNPNFKYPPRPPTQPITGGYSDMIAFMHRVSAVQTTPKPSINGSSSALKTPDRILPSQDEESLRTSTSAVRALETSGTKASLTTSLKEDGQARFEGQRHASSLERPLPTDQRSPPKKSFSHEVKASTPRRRNSPSVPPVRKLASPVVVVQGSRSAQTKPIARTSRSSSPDMPPISIHSGSPQADGARSGLGRSSSFAIVIASPSSSQQRDRRLPPRQVMDNRGSANLLAGIFLAQHKAPKPRWWAGKTYHCEWKDCQAKLHNMDTLRRHIKKQHQSRPEHEMHVCRWAGCGEPPTPKTKVDQQATEEQHHARTFGTADALKDHIEQSHLDAYLWKHGEGPRVTTSREARDIAKHLNDSEGRMVTPNALKPESQDAQRLVPAGYRPTLAWLKAHGYRTREEKGQALLEHLKARRIGPEPNIGIFMQGFGGRLVTRERRRALKVEKGIATAVWPELESGI